jgi:hypothetical protein
MVNSAIEPWHGLAAFLLDPVEPALQGLEPAFQIAPLDQIGDQTQYAHQPGRVEGIYAASQCIAIQSPSLAPDAASRGELRRPRNGFSRLCLFRLSRQELAPL